MGNMSREYKKKHLVRIFTRKGLVSLIVETQKQFDRGAICYPEFKGTLVPSNEDLADHYLELVAIINRENNND